MNLKLLEVMPDVHAGNGLGSVDRHELCVMAMCAAEARLRRGEPIGEATDQCKCVSPVLRELAIARNEAAWESDESRTAWALDLVPKLLGTYDDVRDVRRAAALARYSVRVIAAEALRSVRLLKEAERLATLPEDVRLDVAEAAAQTAAQSAWAAESVRPADAAQSVWTVETSLASQIVAATWTVDWTTGTTGAVWTVARAAENVTRAVEAATRTAAPNAEAAYTAGLDELLRIAMETE